MNEYIDKLSKRVDELRLGPGFAEGVNQGPLINHQAIDKVCHCIDISYSRHNKLWT